MDRKHDEQNSALGRLPAMAPLANPYVPFQLEDPPQYAPGKAFIRGTLFPGLDLPFHGMVNQEEKQDTPMTQLQMIGFAIQELALYLDTHRDDEQALEMYRMYQKLYRNASDEYSRTYGPMNHTSPADGPYRWLDDPWPWEYAQNRED